MKMAKILIAVIAAAGLLFTMSGCSSAPQPEKIDPSGVEGYSDAAAERMLTAINEKDYAKFSQDFDDAMKNAITEQKFNEVSDQLQSQLGKYQSKELSEAYKVGDKTSVLYSTNFAKNNATVSITFSQGDGKMLVSGFYIK